MKLTIGYLYGDLMNIYGDTGNIICLQKRCEWRGIDCVVKPISIGDKLSSGTVDLYFFGGGQDQSQQQVAENLKSKGQLIKSDVEKGIPLLSICGGYQLLGEYYAPFEGPRVEGVGIFPTYTKASHDRMIGNLVIQLPDSRFQTTGKRQNSDNQRPLTANLLVGFENHSGKTYLKPGAEPLGKVLKGFGNNGEDESFGKHHFGQPFKTEGCIYKNAIGCYMHGSLLPKNPDLTDWLIQRALEIKYGRKIELEPLNDELESQAHHKAVQLFN